MPPSATLIRDLLQAHLPDYPVRQIEFVNEGYGNWAYLVNGTHIFRFPKHHNAERELLREMALLPLLQSQVSVQVPAFTAVGWQHKRWTNRLSRYFFGKRPLLYTFVGYPKIEGVELAIPTLLDLDPSRQTQLALDIADFLRAVHTFPVEQAQQCGVSERQYGHDFLSARFQSLAQFTLPKLNTEDRLLLQKIFEPYLQSPGKSSYAPALLHGDLSCEHILVDRDFSRVKGIIDFGEIHIGDPVYDFVWPWVEYGSPFLFSILAAYGVSDIAETYQRIQLFHCCDCAYKIASGLQHENGDLAAEGWERLFKFLKHYRAEQQTELC